MRRASSNVPAVYRDNNTSNMTHHRQANTTKDLDHVHYNDKVHHALRMFESLRVSVDSAAAATSEHSSPLTQRSGTTAAIASARRVSLGSTQTLGNKERAASVPLSEVNKNTYAAHELDNLSAEELRRKLLAAGRIMKALHQKNKELQARLDKSGNGDTAHGDNQQQYQEELASMTAAHTAELKAQKEHHEEELSTLRSVADKMQASMESANCSTSLDINRISFANINIGEEPSLSLSSAAAPNGVDAYLETLKSKLSQLDGLRSRLTGRIAALEGTTPEPLVAPQGGAEVAAAAAAASCRSGDAIQDGVASSLATLLARRLEDAQTRADQLMSVQLAAVMERATANAPPGSPKCQAADLKLVNEEVKKLFSLMKLQLTQQERSHELERARMNEWRYLKERRDAARI